MEHNNWSATHDVIHNVRLDKLAEGISGCLAVRFHGRHTFHRSQASAMPAGIGMVMG